MSIQPLYSQTATNTPATTQTGLTGSKTLDDTKMQFLNLLFAQLKNQDPLSPADTDQFSAQIMQMGQLEQLFNLNESMSSLATSQQGSMIASYSNMVGKQTVATGNIFELGATGGQILFGLNQIPENTKVRIFDQYNNLVTTLEPAILSSGTQQIDYDGLDYAGHPLPSGYYTFTIDATDADAKVIPVTTYSTGTISSIRLENGSPVFQLGNNDLRISDIQKVY